MSLEYGFETHITYVHSACGASLKDWLRGVVLSVCLWHCMVHWPTPTASPPAGCVERVVIDCQGDMDSAAVLLYEQCVAKSAPLLAPRSNSLFSNDLGMMHHPHVSLPQVKVGWVEEHAATPFSPHGALTPMSRCGGGRTDVARHIR